MTATRAVRSAIVIGRTSAKVNGHTGSIGTGMIMGPAGINSTGVDRSEPTKEATLIARDPADPAKLDTFSVNAPNVILGEGQMRRLRIIA
jgi:hypothetical protein